MGLAITYSLRNLLNRRGEQGCYSGNKLVYIVDKAYIDDKTKL